MYRAGHPVSKFVPSDVPVEKLALLGAATDWSVPPIIRDLDSIFSERLDGLNKDLDPWDSQYYMGEFRSLCAKEKMNELNWPNRDYLVQIARFDPAKGKHTSTEEYLLA